VHKVQKIFKRNGSNYYPVMHCDLVIKSMLSMYIMSVT